jgi:hypothetical protein
LLTPRFPVEGGPDLGENFAEPIQEGKGVAFDDAQIVRLDGSTAKEAAKELAAAEIDRTALIEMIDLHTIGPMRNV